MSGGRERNWEVLLLGGVSGSGKTTAGAKLARRLAIPWIGVDDLRLGFQWSRVSLPEQAQTEALYFFLDTPDVWSLPPERLRDGLIAVGALMAPAIDVIVGNHLGNAGPVILEGDGILPTVIEQPEIRAGLTAGRVGVVFIAERDEARLYANYRQRGRGPRERPESEARAEVRSQALFDAWVVRAAEERGLPVVASQPFETLVDRIIAAAARGAGWAEPA